MKAPFPDTPDGRYFVAKRRLWRRTDPNLDPVVREAAVRDLMAARRAVRDAGGDEARREARGRVDEAKRRLGERGPVWWSDGARDWTRFSPENSPYAEWFAALAPAAREAAGF